jgi:putrescine aminotransferase
MMSTGRRAFIGLIGAFHGKTLGALSATSKACFRKDFGGGLLPFTHVPPNDVAALTAAFDAAAFTGTEIAGLILEPVLGEGGIHVLTDEYLRAARALCDRHGANLIFDEVQVRWG